MGRKLWFQEELRTVIREHSSIGEVVNQLAFAYTLHALALLGPIHIKQVPVLIDMLLMLSLISYHSLNNLLDYTLEKNYML